MVGTFSLGGITQALDTQRGLTTKRQAAERQNLAVKQQLTSVAATKSHGVLERSVESANQTREQQLEMYASLDETLNIAKRGMALSDSQNPMDRLELWSQQQVDSRWTAEGNVRRLSYLQSAAAALGGKEVINQQALADEMKLIESDLMLSTMTTDNELAMLTLAEQQGGQLIDSHLNYMATITQTLTQQKAMQTAVLDQLTPEQVEAARQAAGMNDAGTVNIGGVDVGAQLLNDESARRQDRAYQIAVRESAWADVALAELGPEQVQLKIQEAQNSSDGFAVLPNGKKISTYRLQDHLMNMQNKDTASALQSYSASQALLSMAQQNTSKLLQTYSIPQLQSIVKNGGRVPEAGNMQMDLAEVQRIIALKSAGESAEIEQQVMIGTTANPMTRVTDLNQRLSAYEQSLPADSPVRRLIGQQRTNTQLAASMITEGQGLDPQEGIGRISAGVALVEHGEAQIETAIQEEAKRLAPGDTNRQLALTYQMKGQPIPRYVVEQGIVEKYKKGEPLSGWLPPELQGVFRNEAEAALREIQTRDMQTNLGGQRPIAEQREEAAARAMEAVRVNAAAGYTEELFAAQMSPQLANLNNPLLGVQTQNGPLSPSKFLTTVADADRKGALRYQQQANLSDEEMAKLMANGGDAELAAIQAGELLIALDQLKPGLGDAYAAWWESDGRKTLGDTFVGGKQAAANQGGFEQSVATSIATTNLQDQLTDYATTLANGRQRAVGAILQQDYLNYVTFGNDPAAKQAYVLELDKNLNPTQKQQAMQMLIQPILKQAQADGLNPAQTAVAVEQQLRTMQPQDPEARKLRDLILKNRDTALKDADLIVQIHNTQKSWLNPINSITAGITGALGAADMISRNWGKPHGAWTAPAQTDGMTQEASSFDWWNSIKAQ